MMVEVCMYETLQNVHFLPKLNYSERKKSVSLANSHNVKVKLGCNPIPGFLVLIHQAHDVQGVDGIDDSGPHL